MPDINQITGKIIFFAELAIGAKIYRFCTDPAINLVDDDGNNYLFDLPFDFEFWAEEALPFTDGLPTKTVGISLQMGPEIDYLKTLGLFISAGVMTLYRGYKNNLSRESLIGLFSGKVDDWMLLNDGTFAFNLYNDEPSRKRFFDSSKSINAASFPDYTIPDGSLGVYYPIIIGSPGYGIVGDGTYQSAGFAYNANWTDTISSTTPEDLRYIIAGHRLDSSQVYATSSNNEFAPALFDILTANDENGALYSYIDFTGTTGIEANSEIYIGFQQENAGLTGINGVGDFICSFLQNIDKRFDWNKIFAIRDSLNFYKIDTQIIDNPEIWDWTFQNVLSFLPISFLENEKGVYFLLWNFDIMPIETLVVDKDIFRIEDSGLSCSSFDGVGNEILIKAAKNAISGSYAINAAASGNFESAYADPRLVLSRQIFGEKQLEITLDNFSDKATVALILETTIKRYGLPYRFIEYVGDLDLDRFNLGDCVFLYDEELGIEKNAFITGKNVMPESISLKFIIFEQ